MKKVVVALGLGKMTIPQKIEFARAIVIAMTGNSHFVSPNPTLAVISANTNALEAAHLATKIGGKEETAAMHAKAAVLELSLKTAGAYVEGVSNLNPVNAESMVLSSGFSLKKQAAPRANGFRLQAGNYPGEIQMRTDSDQRAVFTWQMTQTPADTATWEVINSSTKAQYLATGLDSGIRYYFRVAKTGKDGQEPWSNVLDIIVA